MPEGPPEDPRELGYYLSLAQVGMEMVAPIGLGAILDRYVWDWGPWGLIGGTVLGFVGGLAHLVTLANRQDSGGRRRKSEHQDSVGGGSVPRGEGKNRGTEPPPTSP